jgi:tetratricopeptide (TPR) repeat protein
MSADPRSMPLQQALQQATAAYHEGRLADAAALCQRILHASPNQLDAINISGALAMRRGDFAAALDFFTRAAGIRPDFAEAFNNRGVALQALGRYEEALEPYGRALALQPGNADALFNRALVLGELRRWNEALQDYEKLLRAYPDHARAWNNCGNLLQKLKRWDEALQCYSQAVRARPDYAEAMNNCGVVLKEMARPEEAIACFEDALRIRPDYPDASSNLGIVLREWKRWDSAMASFDRALAAQPAHVEALINRGLALYDLRRFDEAQASYERALAARPGDAETRWNMSLLALTRGDFERGWDLFESRWQTPAMAPFARAFPQPLWLGDSAIAGKTILIHAEQGLGDTLQFARYVRFVEKLGAAIVFESPAALERLFGSTWPNARVVRKGSQLPPFDVHCPLASLPLALRREVRGIPADFPTIAADRALVDAWAARLGAKSRPRVGIAWSGNPNNKIDADRSIPFEKIAPLLGAAFEAHALQKEIRETDRDAVDASGIAQWCDALGDFADTAALIESLDLVIAVDSVVVHVAASLGKPTWALLPWTTDYRWPTDRDVSPWYPQVRIFRQPTALEWDPPLAALARALGERFGR